MNRLHTSSVITLDLVDAAAFPTNMSCKIMKFLVKKAHDIKILQKVLKDSVNFNRAHILY